MKTFIHAALLAAASLVLGACAFGKNMTPTEIQTYGTHTVKATKAQAFNAITSTLKTRGFAISLENIEKGLIKTERRLIRTAASSSSVGGYAEAQAVGYYRQYNFQVNELPDGQCQIVATPRIFAGDSDISEGQIWVLEGPEGERTLWKSLFKEIDEVL